MMLAWLAIRALLASTFGKLWGWLSHASFWQLSTLALAALFMVQHVELKRTRAEAVKWKNQFNAEHSGRAADRKAYLATQAQAAAVNRSQVAKKNAEYQKVADDEKDAYAHDHAELVRMRKQRDAALEGASSAAGASPDHSPATGFDGHGVPVPSADDLQEARDAAADIELRLVHLQNYVLGTLKVDPNASPDTAGMAPTLSN